MSIESTFQYYESLSSGKKLAENVHLEIAKLCLKCTMCSAMVTYLQFLASLSEVSYLGSHLDSPDQQIQYFLITDTVYFVMYFTALEKKI